MALPPMSPDVQDSRILTNFGTLGTSGICGREGSGVPSRASSRRAMPTRRMLVQSHARRPRLKKIEAWIADFGGLVRNGPCSEPR